MKQKILIILSIFFVLLVVYFFTFANTKDEPDKIEISAVDLWKEFDYNADAATQKFQGASLLVSGTISEISDNFMGSPCILLENGVDTIPAGIFCFLLKSDADYMLNLNVGDEIAIIGTCNVALNFSESSSPFISIEDASIQ